MSFEVNQPILNSAFEPPPRFWYISEGADPELRQGRRPADGLAASRPRHAVGCLGRQLAPLADYERGYELKLVNLVQFTDLPGLTLILETKGYDPLKDVKRAAVERWVAAVNHDGRYGAWRYALATSVAAVRNILDEIAVPVSAE